MCLERAVEAPIIRKLFASSPKDPRYHMLSHLSGKFSQASREQTHEPRAALFLNRFTRTLTVMYATTGIEKIIGISGEAMKGRSFYYCIAENCLQDAVKCLETAKGNDSIAYLRFWFRDPRQDDAPPVTSSEENTDAEMTDVTASDEEDDGGVRIATGGGRTPEPPSSHEGSIDPYLSPLTNNLQGQPAHLSQNPRNSRTSSGDSGDYSNSNANLFGEQSSSSVSSAPTSPSSNYDVREPIELEAVVSCTSDGLVVCLRRARPLIPPSAQSSSNAPIYTNGLYAAPWAQEPGPAPPVFQQPQYEIGSAQRTGMTMGVGYFEHEQGPTRGQMQENIMDSIRNAAIFAWGLTGINGNLTEYSRGRPYGESQPPDGIPVWAPTLTKVDSHDSAFASRSGSNNSGSGNDDTSLRAT